MDTTAQLSLEAEPSPSAPAPTPAVEGTPAAVTNADTVTGANDTAAEPATLAEAGASEAGADTNVSPVSERQRIEEQLLALKRRESELRRALAIADHPTLGEAIRELDGRVFAVARAEEKLAQGLSKSEERRRDTLDRKVSGLREKRAELDAQIGALESELAGLGVERIRGFEQERDAALEQLLAAVSNHAAAIEAAGLDATQLVPDLARFMPNVQRLAEEITARPRVEA